jgi:hypothetical protein
MVTAPSVLVPIECTPGVQPDTDLTPYATEHYTYSDKIRFVNGNPEKIGGWIETIFDNDIEVDGTTRSIYSANINGRVYTMIGTNEKLYVLVGNTLTNITPLDTDTIAIADSLDTHYATLANDPISVTINSTTVTVADTEAAKFKVNDVYTLSGATTTGGVLNTALNADHVIRAIGVNTISFRVGAAATSTATGGGASVVRTSGLLTVNDTAHEQEDGDRVKISGAVDTGGILAADINKEFIIRNVTANTFDVMTEGTATSSVTAGGGAATEYQQEIPAGQVNASFGQGYGMGFYGVGLYGVSKLSTAGQTYPRIWFFDRFGNTIVMTPGNQTGFYQWDLLPTVAPELISGAPDEINYAFVSDNIAVTLGYQEGNEIFASDQGDITEWTASSTNQVYQDDIEGAGRFLSHVSVNGTNLLFTESQTYTFQYVGRPLVWNINLLEESIGIISPMARVAVQGVAYWMDDDNFYMWEGGNVQVIPSNTQYQSTIHDYVFGNLNFAQKSKTFAWFNKEFNEIWWHYPSATSNEPDRVARLNIQDMTWVPDTFDRTAAEYPVVSLVNPKLADVDVIYKHELGTDANGAAMAWALRTNLRTTGKDSTTVVSIMPDSLQTGDIEVTITSRLFPQATATMKQDVLDISPDTTYVPYTVNGRFWNYEWAGEELGQTWTMGKWNEYVQKGAPF